MATRELTILAIDDTLDNLITLKAVVRDALPGAAVSTALSGPQGIALALAEDPDVILLDIVMPEMDGYAVCRALKEDPRTQPIPVVFLTARRADRVSRLQALDAGAEAFLAKPLDEVELIAQIRTMAKIKVANRVQQTERVQLAARVVERTVALEQELAERKRAEAALEETLGRLTRAQRIAHIGSWSDYLPTHQLDWSEEMYRILGFPPSTPVNLTAASRVFPPEELAQFQQAVGAAINADAPYNMDYRIIRPDGAERYIHDEGEIVRDEQGQAIWMHGTTQDITERKRAEAALQESEKRYRALFENVSVGVALISPQMEVLALNRRMREWFPDIRPEQHPICYGAFNSPPRNECCSYCPTRQTLADGQWHEAVTETPTPNGIRHYRIASTAFTDPDGQVVAAIEMVDDITERRQAEVALRESEARFRVIFEHANDAILLNSADDRILQVNPRMCELMGYSREELLTMRMSDLQAPEVRGQSGHVIEAELARHGQVAFESLNLHRSGRRIPVEVSVARIESDKGDRYVSIVRDITERKRAEEALRASETTVQRLLAQQIAINQLALTLGESLDLAAVYRTIHTHIQGMMDVWCFIISSYDAQAKLIRAEYAAADRVYDVAEFPLIPLAPPGRGTQSRVIHTGQPLYTPDHRAAVRQSNMRYTIEDDGSVHEELPPEQDQEDTTGSVVYLPMKIKGQPVGILQVQSRRLDAYSADDISLLAGMANVAAVAVQNARLHAEVLRELEVRTRTEAALLESHDLLVNLARLVPGVIYQYRLYPDGRSAFPFASPGMNDIYEVTPEAVREDATPVFGRLHPDDYDHVVAAIQESAATLLPFHCEFRVVLPRQGLRWRLSDAMPERMENGGTLWHGIISDITERKQAEAERERLLAQVQAQAQQIAQLMDAVPEGVLLLAADGQVLLANPAGVRDLATLAGATLGDRLTHLGELPLAELLAAAARSGSWHELRAGRHIFEAIARPVVADSSAPGQWVLVINDVTYARDLRNQLQQQERLAVVGQLAAGIAHDFNNILAIIALQASLIAHAPGLAERDRERLTIISEQTGHATRLIQQILDFSRRAVLERRPLDLGPLLREQVKLLARTLPETVEVTLDCAPGEYVVLVDPTRLQQILMNLAVNARDAMPAGGTLRLTLAHQATAPRPDLPPGPWVRLAVTDSGTGIAAETQAHLFEPFFTTKPRGQGTGLGLAQIHGIVKQHDGEITVQSASGQGATFTIYLPAVAEPAAAGTGNLADCVTRPPAGAAQLILIVEDNAVLLDAMTDTVESLGYRVIGAGNGEDALAVLAERGDAIALVLSDLIMPVMGGAALFQAMRARGLTTPVVILSGHPLEGELAELKTQGLAGWLLKPPDLADLARLLAQTLDVKADL